RSIHMVTDEKSGLFKGCAFVHMTTAAEAKDAINTIDGVSLHKRIISVTEALPRKTVTPAAKSAAEKPQKSRRPPKRRQ
ncbi:MAG: RNA-binding protein, partial [Desulfuromonadales bacterium]|nr:RNA-binding protein [Desulfuromonadales bacterium]